MSAPRAVLACLVFICAGPAGLSAQQLSHRGFFETRAVGYPQEAVGDERRAFIEGFVRYEPVVRLTPRLRVFGGVDLRADSWGYTGGRVRPDVRDSGLLRPPVSIRRLQASLTAGGATLDLGKQFIRWGKTDILTPTDRFAPRDLLEVTDDDFLGVSGARLSYERGEHTIDLVWVPWFTPSRVPLLGGRWAPLPSDPFVPPPSWTEHPHPGGSQWGARWSSVGARYEASASVYDGFNHLPLIETVPQAAPARIDLVRLYPRMRMIGGDVVVPLRWLTVKGETGYFTSRDSRADEYVLYVVQVERQSGEWSFVGGYAGEVVTDRRAAFEFSPDRGLARAFVGRAGYTIGPNRSVAVEAAQRQGGGGTWVRAEYSQARGAHWRTTVAATIIGGGAEDFLGQYSRNSHVSVAVRYSF